MAKTKEQDAAAQTVVTEESGGLLDKILTEGRMARDDFQKERAKDMIGEFVNQVMSGELTMSKNMDVAINSRIAEIDRLVSAQMNEIMHHEDFQKLEGSWRGLHHLLKNSLTGTLLKIKVMSVTKNDLLKDFERALEFDQSALFKKVYEEEYGTFGGAPFGALIGDFEFGNHPQDMALLENISQVAAAAHAPFLSAASAGMFGWDNFGEMSEVRDVSKIFDRTEYMKWRSFRESEDSRYVGLTLPHVLMREPYGAATKPTETFRFEEDVDGKDHKKYLWGNAAYALGTRLTEAFSMYGWCVAIRGVEGGGLVQGLPTHTFETDEGEIAMKCPTEVAVTDRREKEFADNGFIPLVHCKGTDYAAFFGTQSANKAKKYDSDAANANARLSTQLQYIFAVSRFAHYLKSMMRDKIGSFMSRSECEMFLNKWIMNYVTEDDNASAATKSQYPLREAKVEVAEIPGKPGCYRAVAFLRPHFQLDELSVSLRLVADLPQPANG
ncbi:MAG TPA: type VI secretion system contractile sheath large subunit [Pyrinomonadaceae bacterium]|nr:type VI secretion system contractile sheath large subunit [Chloracidobacterium sp.]MBP9935483.1 type VI secretion system contractile sheath large subunit [Pyrinomonadaceae bacterium]MBK7801902.1 type VI secretion system contractile sheath large subunit [Chloracidobacterium sp.]MBK9437955.1 type VI secretion system contractile sheath large subunit [Chloracidobacterium sp.]MBL0242207.1 type VI secretion system contractile sheath large subunit [Chloracidobacterium sp.]